MKRTKFEEMMDRTGDLATLPIVAQKVLEVIHHEDTTAKTLKEIISNDPVLSADILRLANSAYYRTAGTDRIADIQRAVVLMGFVSIRNLVLTTCMRSLYSKEFRTKYFTAGDLWIHSVAVAVIGRTLANYVYPALADEAFLAGLLHDVGMIVEWKLFPGLFPEVLGRYHGTGKDFLQAERETLGFDHCQAGAAVLKRWKLPKEIRQVVAHHHDPKNAGDMSNILPKLINVAERVCCQRGTGFFDLIRDDQDISEMLEALDLTNDAYRVISEQVDEELDKARDLLSV